MKAVLYICHGSRERAGQQAALSFIEKTKRVIDIEIQEACFLELAEPSMEQGIASCVSQGATEIIAIPFLLLTAGHAKHDIPNMLQQIMKKYPHVRLVYGETLGVDERIVEVLIKRLHAVRDSNENGKVLLVGRGSSDEAIPTYFSQITDIFKQKTGINDVQVCYLAACEPRFEQALHDIVEQQPKDIYVLPYLLFPGFLMNYMKKFIEDIHSSSSIHLCPSLGYSNGIRNVLVDRVNEMIKED